MTKSVQITLRLSPELHRLAEQALMKGQFRSMNDLIRACLRFYIDETDDVLGSRRHFNKTMGERLDRLEALAVWQSAQTQMLVARGLFTVLDELRPEDAEAEPPTPDMQMGQAGEATKRALPHYIEAQDAIIETLAQHVAKQRAARAEKASAKAKKGSASV